MLRGGSPREDAPAHRRASVFLQNTGDLRETRACWVLRVRACPFPQQPAFGNFWGVGSSSTGYKGQREGIDSSSQLGEGVVKRIDPRGRDGDLRISRRGKSRA